MGSVKKQKASDKERKGYVPYQLQLADEYEEDACNQKDCLYLSDHAGNQNCDEYTSSFYQPGLHQNNYKQRVQQWNYRSYDRFLI